MRVKGPRRRLPLTVTPLTVNLFLATSLLAQDPLARRWDHVVLHHDALRYDVTLSLPDSGGVIEAEVATRWRLTGTGPVVLDLVSAMGVRRGAVDRALTASAAQGEWRLLPD